MENGGDKTRREANGCALTLLREIAEAPTLHHAFSARDALFHMRLLAKSVADEMDRTWVEQGLTESDDAACGSAALRGEEASGEV